MFGGFNPRARVGRDSGSVKQDCSQILFQSTRPRGARQQERLQIHNTCPFQSTRPRGARRGLPYAPFPAVGFNPRARVGRDRLRRFRLRLRRGFNPRARVGRDKARITFTPYMTGFNPRARVGRDCIPSISRKAAPYIRLFRRRTPCGV